jgi:hypothetical protein
MSRRTLLRNSGLVVGLGAIAAACGEDASGAPGRIGIAPPPATLPEGVVDDVALLRTAQSLEYSVLEVYEVLMGTGVLSADEQALFDRLVADHTRHAAEVGELIVAAGGEQHQCPNAFFMRRSVTPAMDALDGSDDVHRDVLNIAFSFETLLGQSYQSYVKRLEGLNLRSAMVVIGGEDQRHATVLARIINPDNTFAPTFFGEPEEKDSDGFPIPYAIPSVFGSVAGLELVVGAQNDEGARTSVQLQTPAENTFVYDYMSC